MSNAKIFEEEYSGWYVAKHMGSPVAEIRAYAAELGKEAEWDILMSDTSPIVRAAVAKYAAEPYRRRLITDPHVTVRSYVAIHSTSETRALQLKRERENDVLIDLVKTSGINGEESVLHAVLDGDFANTVKYHAIKYGGDAIVNYAVGHPLPAVRGLTIPFANKTQLARLMSDQELTEVDRYFAATEYESNQLKDAIHNNVKENEKMDSKDEFPSSQNPEPYLNPTAKQNITTKKTEKSVKLPDIKTVLYDAASDTYNTILLKQNLAHFLQSASMRPCLEMVNQALLYQHMPNATELKSFEEWKSISNPVKKGEKSVKLLQQMENGRDKAISVFDVSQTTEGAQKKTPITPSDLYDVLKASSVYTVVETEHIQLPGDRKEGDGITVGYKSVNSIAKQTIYLQEKLTDAEKAGCLIKELCKLQTHGRYDASTQMAEYMLRLHYGLPANFLLKIPSASRLQQDIQATLKITRDLSQKIDKNFQALQRKELPDYHINSIRDDNEIDADRERTRENLGFRENSPDPPVQPREPVALKGKPMAERLDIAQQEAQRRDALRKEQASEKKSPEQAAEKEAVCVS